MKPARVGVGRINVAFATSDVLCNGALRGSQVNHSLPFANVTGFVFVQSAA